MKKFPQLFLEMYSRTSEKTEEVDAVCDYLAELYSTFKHVYNELIKKHPVLLSHQRSVHYRSVLAFERDISTECERTWVDGEHIFLGTESNYGDGTTDYGCELKIETKRIFGVSDLQAKEYMKELANTVFFNRMQIAEANIALKKAKYKEQVDTNHQKQLEEARKLLEQNGYKVVGDNE